MGPVFYVMAILGCGDTEQACRQVRLVETRYDSADACRTATAAVLPAHADLDFPVVRAECLSDTQALASAAR